MLCILCNNDKIYKGKVCKNCYDKLPKTFNINKEPKIFYLLKCEKHNYYLSSSNNTKCPSCVEEQENEIDKQNKKDLMELLCDFDRNNPPDKYLKKYCDIHEIFYLTASSTPNNKCPTCIKNEVNKIKEKFEKERIWDLENLPKTFNLNNIPIRICKKYCNIHKTYYLTNTNKHSNCPICKIEKNLEILKQKNGNLIICY